MALFTGSKEGWENQHFLLANWLEVLPYKWVERSKKMKPSFDSVMALMRELSIEEQKALVDSDNRPAIKQFLLSLQAILTHAGTVNVRPVVKFIAQDLFKVNISQNALVKISYIGDNFKEGFLGKNEEPLNASGSGPDVGPYRTPGENGNAGITLRYHTLNRNSLDKPIIAELGGEAKVETSLAQIAALLTKQANGEGDALLTNGYANIFYVRSSKGVLCAVDVIWYGDGWYVHANSVEYPHEWYAGNQVFSCDS